LRDGAAVSRRDHGRRGPGRGRRPPPAHRPAEQAGGGVCALPRRLVRARRSGRLVHRPRVPLLRGRPARGGRERTGGAGALGAYFSCLDAAITHLRAADAIDTVVVSAHATGALVAALWCHARRGSQPMDALILASPELGAARRWSRRAAAGRENGTAGRASPLLAGAQRRLWRGLEIACPVLVMCPAVPGYGPGGS